MTYTQKQSLIAEIITLLQAKLKVDITTETANISKSAPIILQSKC